MRPSTCNLPSQYHDLRIEAVLLLENTRTERLLCITVEYGYCRLCDDRAAIRAFIDEMDGAAADLHPVGEHVAMGMRTGEARQECRMDIHDAARVGADEIRREDAHEARKHDERHARLRKLFDERFLELLPILVFLAIHTDGGNTSLSRALERIGLRLVREHDAYRCMHLAARNRVDDGLQIRAATRAEHAEHLFLICHRTRRL